MQVCTLVQHCFPAAVAKLPLWHTKCGSHRTEIFICHCLKQNLLSRIRRMCAGGYRTDIHQRQVEPMRLMWVYWLVCKWMDIPGRRA